MATKYLDLETVKVIEQPTEYPDNAISNLSVCDDDDSSDTYNITTYDEDIYWDIHPMLTYGALFSFIVGNRGGGKTFGAKKFCINRFIKKGEQFIYVRRYKQELKRIKTFFDDIKQYYPDNDLKVNAKGEFVIDGVQAGCAIPLSTAKIEKSVAFPKVATIIFDEFILDKGTYHYLPDEVTAFLELYETISRMRDVRVIFLSNALTITNPYFLYFNLQMPYKSNIWCKDDILIELVAKEEFVKAKEQTRFGKLIKGTAYGDYAINNNFLRDNPTFIEKKSGQCWYLVGMKYKGKVYGVWWSYALGKAWVSYDYEKQSAHMYALTKEDQSPNVSVLSGLRNSRWFSMFEKAFMDGYLYYESQNIKNAMYEVVKLYLRY